MTREKKISRLKDILSEINENDNAVCYLTSEDNELIESAIEALEQEPCEDCISRKDVLEAFKQEEPLVWCDGADEIAAYDQWSSDVDTIKNMPSVQPQPKTERWIPVNEELPKPRIDVWCNSDMGQMVGYYDEYVKTWYGRDYLELIVTAWMPLPLPYKPQESEEEYVRK